MSHSPDIPASCNKQLPSLLRIGAQHADMKHNESIRDAYNNFCGIPRICFRALQDGGELGLIREIESALNSITSIDNFFRSTTGILPFADKASNKLVRIEPVEETNYRKAYPAILSGFIARRVFDRMLQYRLIKASDSIMNLLSDTAQRGYGGTLFEQAVHYKFRSGFQLRPQPLTENATGLEIDILKFDNEAEGYFRTLDVRAGPNSRAVHQKYLNRYLIPISKTQESVDAVWISKTMTVFFQMTVKRYHGTKLRGVIEALNQLPAHARTNICIVFVVPKNDIGVKGFQSQKILAPVGTPQELHDVVAVMPQYMYEFDVNVLYM